MAVSYDELFDASANGLDDPYTLEKWRILDLPNVGPFMLSPLACEEVSLPFSIFQQKTREIATTSVSWPKAVSVSSFSARFHMDQKAAVLKYFGQWERLIQNPYTGGFYLPSRYKKNMTVALYDNAGVIIHQHELRNVWPQGVQELGLNGTGGRAVISIQFECDVVRPQTT